MYKTCKTNHSIQQLLQFGLKAFKACKTPILKKRSFKKNTFRLQQGTILRSRSHLVYIMYKQTPLLEF